MGDRPGRGLVFATADGGEQLALRPAERRRLLEIGIGADDPDDLGRVEAGLRRLGVEFKRDAASLRVRDPNSALHVSVRVSPRITEAAAIQEPTNGPGRPGRPNGRAPAIERAGRVRPRRLGHVVVGSLDQEASQRFFTEGLGFKVSDRVPGLASFMRCSTDHHNLLVQQAPLNFLHHTAWEVDDIDEVGRGATAMLDGHPERHVWGLGRHHIGSNFFWYLKDPVGNFSEYYSDLDIILDDQLWQPSVVEGARGEPVRGDVGELVVTKPVPSMPVSFWNDPGSARYREAYFGIYPGEWRYGDWITITDRWSVVVHGRSDATLNRHGIRMGSSDIYHVVEQLDEIAEALRVGVERPEEDYWMPLFVVLNPGHELGDALTAKIRQAIREGASPRHVPDEIIAAPAIPHTRTGKKLEIPVKRILQGGDPRQVMEAGAVDNPDALQWFAAYQTRTIR